MTAAGQITLLIWPDYIDPQNLADFEQQTGIPVRLEIVPSAVEMVERMRAPGPAPDVLVPPEYAARELSEEGLLLELDHSRLPNLAHIENRFKEGRAYDPDCRWSVIKDWGTTGFLYRTDRITETLNSWADFWALAAKYSGRVSVLDSPGEVIGAALKMRGRSYNAVDAPALAKAQADLERLKPHLHSFETNYRPLVLNDEVWLALGWNGDAAALKAVGVPVRYVVPAEGSQVWEDDWAIARAAPHPEAAYAFLNFMLDPKVAAAEARYTRYATGNRQALKLLEAGLREDPATYPLPGVLANLEAGLPLDAAGAKRRGALWTAIR